MFLNMHNDGGLIQKVKLYYCGAVILFATVLSTRAQSLWVSVDNGTLVECSYDGTILRSFPAQGPSATIGTEYLRSSVLDGNGDLWIYNGTFTPAISKFDPTTAQWQQFAGGQFATGNNVSYGGIGIYGPYIFVTDQYIAGHTSQGVVRYDETTGAVQRFATNLSPTSLCVGFDGLLYVVDGSALVHVYDPISTAELNTIQLGGDPSLLVSAIAVLANGDIITSDDFRYVTKRNSAGGIIAQVSPSSVVLGSGASPYPFSIAPLPDGRFAVAGRFGEFFIISQDFTSCTTVPVEPFHTIFISSGISTVGPYITGTFQPLAGTLDIPFSQILDPSVFNDASSSILDYRATGLPPGLSIDPTSGTISGAPVETGTFTTAITAYDTGLLGQSATTTVQITIVDYSAPSVVGSLSSMSARMNEAFSQAINTAAFQNPTSSPLNYRADGLPPGLSIDPVTGVISGVPTQVGAFNVAITAYETSPFTKSATTAFTFTVGQAASRLVNLSSRAFVGTDANILIGGFVIDGNQPKTVLVRASGPALQNFGVTGCLSDPTLELNASGSALQTNDNWSDDPQNKAAVLQAVTIANAFPWADGSKDAALVATLAPGAYTALVRGRNNSQGVALIEVYEVDLSNLQSKLVNVSARSLVQTGSGVQIAGFVVQGSLPKRVIIRASGPALQKYGVTGFLVDPKLEIHDSSGIIATNDNWDASIEPDFQRAGIDNWQVGSRDAAVVQTLNPGAYTAVLSGVNGATGVALIEVFDAD